MKGREKNKKIIKENEKKKKKEEEGRREEDKLVPYEEITNQGLQSWDHSLEKREPFPLV